MPGDTLRHRKAPSFGYFRLAKEVHAVQVCAFVHLSPFFFSKKITPQKYETIRLLFQVFEILCKNTFFLQYSQNFFRQILPFSQNVCLYGAFMGEGFRP